MSSRNEKVCQTDHKLMGKRNVVDTSLVTAAENIPFMRTNGVALGLEA